MKKIIGILLSICFMLTLCLQSVTVYAQPGGKEPALTLCYSHNDKGIAGLEVKSFLAAAPDKEAGYSLVGAFAELPIKLYDISSQAEWSNILSTLVSYIEADGIKPDYIAVTDAEGCVRHKGIKEGIYLTLSVNASEAKLVFESFLTVVPMTDEKGELNYNVVAKPKYQSVAPDGGESEYKVIKQWRDYGSSKRPSYIEVDILKDGVFVGTQKLNDQNNWCYSWTVKNDGSQWQAVERNVPKGYSVTVTKNQTTIIITNTANETEENPPQTGDSAMMWQWIVAMGISGAVFILLALWQKKKDA